ncbi:MAG TPA: hypothetical protein VK066_05570 [Chloroflexota bacterium]|nr:hypothetical protein [Chloroflexota bacterium]
MSVSTKAFSIGEALSFGWETTKSNFPYFVGLLVIAALVDGVPQFIGNRSGSQSAAALMNLVGFLLNLFISIGITKISLEFCDRRSPGLADLFSGGPVYLSYLLASILFSLMVGIGLVFFVVPGIVLAIVFQFFSYVIVDRGLGPMAALSRSAAITKGVRWNLFGLALVLVGLNLLGLLALVVGLFVTVPITIVAIAYVYRKLDAQTGAVPVLA